MIRIELNDEAVTSALARLSGKLGDMTDLMNDIGRLLVASTKERIAAGRTPDDTPFVPRSQVTLARVSRTGEKPPCPAQRQPRTPANDLP